MPVHVLFRGHLYITGTLGGAYGAFATGINNLSEVVGYYDAQKKSFYWTEGSPPVTLTVDNPRYGSVWAWAINDQGRVAGEFLGDSPIGECANTPVALQWMDPYAVGTAVFCPAAPHYGIVGAFNINESGQIAGIEHGENIEAIGWSWKDGVKQVVPERPDTSGSCESLASGVNEGGYVVGYYFACDAPLHAAAYIWNVTDDHTRLLGTLTGGEFSAALDINDDRFVVGYADGVVAGRTPTGLIRTRGFIWHAHFGMRALPPPPGYTLNTECYALAVNNINASGLIQAVGYCTKSGKYRAARWDVRVVKAPWTGLF